MVVSVCGGRGLGIYHRFSKRVWSHYRDCYDFFVIFFQFNIIPDLNYNLPLKLSTLMNLEI